MKKIFLYLLLFPVWASAQYKDDFATIELVIAKAGPNKNELTTALRYYQQKKEDSLKLKAMYFLLSNMDIHYSADYYWADSNGKRIPFKELDYNNFEASVKGFDSLKSVYGKLRPMPVKYRDVETARADFLIDCVEKAFKVWRPAKTTFEDFCEYILPYRITVEPVQDWRDRYRQRFSWLIDSSGGFHSKQVTKFLINDVNNWFTCLYDLEKRTEPLPRLGALQVLHRKKGYCEDVADLSVFALRSQGIASSVDIIPWWATSSGSHQLNFAQAGSTDKLHFDVLFKSDKDTVFKLVREPGKVLRVTYSKQKNSLPLLADTAEIPPGILQNCNLKDVTAEYWPVGSFDASLLPAKKPGKIVYACVFNYHVWQPVWWSNNINNSKAVFDNMSKGVVYLPQYYKDKKLVPAGYPVAFGYNNVLVLKPDTVNRRTVVIKEQDKYLRFQTGKKYRLFYWDNQWKPVAEKMAAEKTTSLEFQRVPANALLVLVPEYTKRKERPFIITTKGERIWF